MAETRDLASEGRRPSAGSDQGFTLIEMLLVVAVIGILTSLVIAAVTNSAADARLVIARQQQATVQEALNAWIASTSISGAQALYSTSSASQRMGYVSRYLDTNSRWYSTLSYTNNVQSENMRNIGVSMVFGAWGSTNYPVVQLLE